MPAINFCLLCGFWPLTQVPGLNQANLSEPFSKLPHLCSHLRGASASPEASLGQELRDTAPPPFQPSILKTKTAPSGDTGQVCCSPEKWSSNPCR